MSFNGSEEFNISEESVTAILLSEYFLETEVNLASKESFSSTTSFSWSSWSEIKLYSEYDAVMIAVVATAANHTLGFLLDLNMDSEIRFSLVFIPAFYELIVGVSREYLG